MKVRIQKYLSDCGIMSRRKAEEESELHLEPIRFRYSTEAVVEEAPAEVTEEK